MFISQAYILTLSHPARLFLSTLVRSEGREACTRHTRMAQHHAPRAWNGPSILE